MRNAILAGNEYHSCWHTHTRFSTAPSDRSNSQKPTYHAQRHCPSRDTFLYLHTLLLPLAHMKVQSYQISQQDIPTSVRIEMKVLQLTVVWPSLLIPPRLRPAPLLSDTVNRLKTMRFPQLCSLIR